ncbi:hypothetical protein Bra1253DRAFT_00440 [Bradyrhizobium sp. WSM1253]|nr:hypothetical protein Bra1253DRAFT_00440 [Bradyrhizobium sp. WSM1253]
MVWAVDAAQSGRAQTAGRFLSLFNEVREAKFGERYFVFKWALETLVNELLGTKKKAPPKGGLSRRLDCTKFATVATCINTLRDLEDAEDGIVLSRFSALDIMHKIGHRQFEWQRGFFSYSQIYRTLTVFGGDLAKDYFRQNHDISIAEFFNCGFAFYALCQDLPGFKKGVNLTEINLSAHVRDRALGLLSAPLASIQREATSVRQIAGRSTAYQRSVLRKTPILQFGKDVARAPLYSHCRRNPKLKTVSPESVGMLLTLDPWLQMSHQLDRVLEHARKIAGQIDGHIIDEDCKRVLFCSIDDFENTLEIASEESLIGAIRATSKPEFRGWFLFNVHQRTSGEGRRNPYPFAGRVADMIPAWNDKALPLSDPEETI